MRQQTGPKGRVPEAVVREARAWHEARKAIPTPSQMSKRLGISLSFLRMICAGTAYKRIR